MRLVMLTHPFPQALSLGLGVQSCVFFHNPKRLHTVGLGLAATTGTTLTDNPDDGERISKLPNLLILPLAARLQWLLCR
jgi:hypothetical protein